MLSSTSNIKPLLYYGKNHQQINRIQVPTFNNTSRTIYTDTTSPCNSQAGRMTRPIILPSLLWDRFFLFDLKFLPSLVTCRETNMSALHAISCKLSNELLILCTTVCTLLRFWETVVTARKQSCGKVMFYHLSVSHSVHREFLYNVTSCLTGTPPPRRIPPVR